MRLQRHGIAVDVPHGWDVRVFRRPAADGETSNPVLHAATFPLPRDTGDFGSNAVDVMRPGDVFTALVEFDREAAATALFRARGWPRPRPHDFSPRQLQRALPGQSGWQRFFTVSGRAFTLYVVLGAHHRRVHLVPVAQRLLDGLSVGARR